MENNQEKINQILLSKNLNEFYYAVVENRKTPLNDEDMAFITKKYDNDKVDFSESAKSLEAETILENSNNNKIANSLARLVFGMFASIKRVAILTMVDGEFYDLSKDEYIDFKREKIVSYDKLINYYDDTNARIRRVTQEDLKKYPSLTPDEINNVLLEYDDSSIYREYEEAHIYSNESDDLTFDFLNEVNGKSHHTLSKKIKK